MLHFHFFLGTQDSGLHHGIGLLMGTFSMTPTCSSSPSLLFTAPGIDTGIGHGGWKGKTLLVDLHFYSILTGTSSIPSRSS